ncbi:YdcF family protein [Microbacterium rhizomatis]|uniref:YdcF family protein n=1 Tax=Microbacterium rhizomatis TaxID=1631477 RepID=A0A5J5J258_9MICO|nr:YdcF family protein [Microbacterium rhizomatis]KAA9107769.1 YdcF family protein [Microbacterium rhizomatis]
MKSNVRWIDPRALRSIPSLLLTAVAGVVLIALAGLPLYVFPPAETAEKADLIYVIGPPSPARIALEEAMRHDGIADAALISVSPPGDRKSAADLAVCTDLAVTCESPLPFTTKGETAMLAAYAADHDVQTVIVITFTPHVARTRYIFDKCYPGKVTVVGIDEHLTLSAWAYQYLYQSTAFVKAALTPCPPG